MPFYLQACICMIVGKLCAAFLLWMLDRFG